MVARLNPDDATAAPGTPAPNQPRPARPPGGVWRWWALVTLAYALATVAMTWPYAAHLRDATPGGGDPLLQTWIARWVQHALVTSPRHLFDANIFYPHANTLAYSDANVPAALLAAPLYLLTRDALLAVNLLVLGTFVLAASGACALLTALTGNRAVGFLAGLAYAFLPYRYAHIYHLNQLGHAWTPWVLLALLLLLRRPSWGMALACGALFGVQAVTSFYVAFQVALAVGVVLAVALIAAPAARRAAFLGRLGVAALVAALIIVPLALPYLQVRDEQGFGRTVAEAEPFAATPASFLKVTAENRAWGWLQRDHGGEDTLFPGGITLAGAALGLLGWRRHRATTIAALLIGMVAGILALGPTWRPGAGGGTPLPYRFLFEHFPFFTAMRVPARFGVLADLALVVLAGLGFVWAWDGIARRLPRERALPIGGALAALLALATLGELRAAPLHLEPVDRSPATAAPYRWLAEQPGDGAVMTFPVEAINPASGLPDERITLAMFWSTLHWKPLVQGYSGFAPRGYGDAIEAFRGDLHRPDGTIARDISYVNGSNVRVLQDLGVRYLVYQRDAYAPADWPAVVAQLAGTGQVAGAEDFGATTIYRLRDPDPGALPAALDLALYAPALATPDRFWEPTLVVRNPQEQLALLTTKRPLRLTTTWRDEAGRQVRQDTLIINLPPIVPPGELACSVRLCPAASGASAPAGPQGTRGVRLQPDRPGRYSVELAVSGEVSASRTLEVEVVSGALPAATGGPPLAFVAASAAADDYRPGQRVELTLDWEARTPAPEDYTLFAQLIGPDGKVWGQYDAPAGWTSHYTSAWLPGERVSLPWVVPLQPDAPPGQYRLLIGMYRRTATGVERVTLAYPGGDAPEYWVGEIAVRAR